MSAPIEVRLDVDEDVEQEQLSVDLSMLETFIA